MSETKHTPGPWKPNVNYTAILSSGGDNRMSGIAEVRTWVGQKQRIANADLIAAAPELLEACDAARKAIDYLFARLAILDRKFYPSKSGQPWEALLQCNSAIDKARGEVTNSLPDEPSKGSAGEG